MAVYSSSAVKSILSVLAALTIGAAGVLTLSSGATVTGNIVPTADSTYSLGTPDLQYASGYFDVASLSGKALKQSYTYVVAESGGDYTSVSSAVAACPSNGCVVYVSTGTYTETVPATLNYSNTHVILAQDAVIQVNGANVPTYFIGTSGTSRIRIEGGKMLQTNASAQGTAIDMSNVSNSWIEKMRIEEFGLAVKYSDTANSTFYNTLSNMQLFNNNNCIEYSGTQPNNNSVYSVRCRPKSGGAGTGLKVIDTRGLTVTGSDFEPAASAGITGISIDATSREITLVNNWIENNQTGLSIASGANRVTVLGGSITSNSTDVSDAGTNTSFLNTSETGSLLSYQTINSLNLGAATLTNSISGTTLRIDPNGTAGTSTSTGGAVLLENTGNAGAGFVIYSNNASPTGRLMNIRADNAAFSHPALHIDYDGTANAFEILHSGTDSTNLAASIVSTNLLDTTLGVSGYETGKGTVKITHNYTQDISDVNASALSLLLSATTAGTAAQGIFLDTNPGLPTSGKLLNLRNDGDEMLTLSASGNLALAGGMFPASVASDPCGSYPSGSFFYNGTAGVPCYCNNAGADIKMVDGSACF
jgi:hypothetical protein